MPTLAPPAPRDAVEQIRRWLAGDGRWLTVVGPPGIGKRRAVREALDGWDGAVTILGAADAGEPPGRVIAIGGRWHRHPEEAVVEVGPLPLDRAAALFVERARRAGIALDADDPTAETVARRLDGHPLAIELLAGRLTVLGPEALLRRLDRPAAEGLDPLMHATGAPWDGLRRQLDEAWDGLGEAARETLRACALFAGPFSAADVARICGGDRLDALQTLRDHSFLAAGPTLPAVVRRYVVACHPPPEPAIRGRHLRWLGDRVAELARRAIEPDALEAIAAFEAELRRAVYAFADGMADDSHGMSDGMDGMSDDSDDSDDSDAMPDRRAIACDAARALAALYESRGGREPAEVAALAARLAPPADVHRRVEGHICAARAARLAGDSAGARAWLDAVADEGGGDNPSAGLLLGSRYATEVAALATLVGDLDRAAELGEVALARARRLGDPLLEARALINLGGTRHWQNRLDDAVAAYSAARAISRRLGATRLLSISATNVCLVDILRGRLADARVSGEESLAAFIALGDRRGEGTARNNLGMIALETDHLDDAARHFEAAAACHDAVGFRQHAAYARLNLAEIAIERGERPRHDRIIDRLEALNGGHPSARVPIPGESPLNDRALTVHIDRARVRSALVRGDVTAAEAALERARGLLADAGPSPDLAEVEVLAVQVALARDDVAGARRALRSAREAAGAHTVDRIATRIAVLGAAMGEPGDAVAALGDALRDRVYSLSLRRTLRLVWPHLPRAVRREALARRASSPSLCLDPPTHEVRLPDGRWISLDRRRLLWTLLGVLFDADRPLDPDALIAEVWPGEQIQPEAAANRLYNAVALLRKAGLAAHLERMDAGYRLDPGLARARLDPDPLP